MSRRVQRALILKIGYICVNYVDDYTAGCTYVLHMRPDAFLLHFTPVFGTRVCKWKPGPSNSARVRDVRSNAQVISNFR